MAENSPLKQSRAFHPYGRVKSPLKQSPQQTVPPAQTSAGFAAKMIDNYFSFSGGSSSLFPKSTAGTGGARTAMADVPGVVNHAQTQRTLSIFNKDTGIFTTKPTSTSIFPFGKSDSGNPPQAQTKPISSTALGAIGSRRPLGPVTTGKPLRGIGFIPVQRSFTIWGDADSNSNSMEFADEIKKEKDDDNDEENKAALALTPEELHRSKSVRKNLFKEGVEQLENVELDKSTASGILTERKNVPYDSGDYVADIYKYYLDYEYRVPIKSQYMSKQMDITHNMRSILIDWLVEVGLEYGFEEGTIFVAVSFVDRFLGRMGVVRNKLQLVGTTAMYIASKLLEVEPPGIADIVHITDETYSKEQILIMEGIMLRTIQFDLLVPTACDFLRALGSLLALETHLISLALYLAELSMIDGERFLRYNSSVIATAAIALSRYTHEDTFWDSRIEHFSELTYPDVRPAAGDLLVAFYDASSSSELTAVYEKYKSVRYNCVSLSILRATLPPP